VRSDFADFGNGESQENDGEGLEQSSFDAAREMLTAVVDRDSLRCFTRLICSLLNRPAPRGNYSAKYPLSLIEVARSRCSRPRFDTPVWKPFVIRSEIGVEATTEPSLSRSFHSNLASSDGVQTVNPVNPLEPFYAIRKIVYDRQRDKAAVVIVAFYLWAARILVSPRARSWKHWRVAKAQT
jgi:hypothetical protein